MEPEARLCHADAVARPLAELLACPPVTGDLLNASAEYIEFGSGETIFRQGAACRGLYVIVSGQLLRKAERLDTRLILGAVRAGDLVELAAALGDGRHTYTLTAQSSGSLMMLPLDSLQQAFRAYPPLRMRLLEELAREVSRAYIACCSSRVAGTRRRGNGSSAAQN
jgi:CRP-like cAMP-binding protein